METQVVHAGDSTPRFEGAAVMPIFQCAVFQDGGGEAYHDVTYPRLSNLPNHVALGRKLAVLEGGELGLVTASGMAAITTTLLTILGKGGHLLVQENLYGGTHSFVTRHLADWGLEYDFIAGNDPGSWKDKLRPNTRAIYVETITNPLLEVADHLAVVAFARQRGLVSIIDNTFTTPVNFRPLNHGFDLVVHSATKYLNGHSDLVAGAVIGGAERVQQIKHHLDHLGGNLDPHACYLLSRGLKTLVLRVRRQGESALTIARHLAEHPAVTTINYPGLAAHPQHGRARELFAGFGGMLSFTLDDGARAMRFVERLRLVTHAPSLGGVETLATRPVATSHSNIPAADRERLGITDSLVRISVGIEDPGDLLADIDQALAD